MVVTPDKLVSAVIKKENSYPNADLGIEIECEFQKPLISLSNNFNLDWKLTHDHSLREHGYEFVSRPLALHQLRLALESIPSENEFFIKDSARAGVHIHLNITHKYTMGQLGNLLKLYIILEPMLIGACHPARTISPFCRPCYIAEDICRQWGDLYKAPFGYMNQQRYSALNIDPLYKFGTVEFRFIQSTLDTDLIFKWCRFFMMLRETMYVLPHDHSFGDEFRGKGEKAFFKGYVPPWILNLASLNGVTYENRFSEIEYGVFSSDWLNNHWYQSNRNLILADSRWDDIEEDEED